MITFDGNNNYLVMNNLKKTVGNLLLGVLSVIFFVVLLPELSYKYYFKNDAITGMGGVAIDDLSGSLMYRSQANYPGGIALVERKVHKPFPYIVGGVVFLILLFYKPIKKRFEIQTPFPPLREKEHDS